MVMIEGTHSMTRQTASSPQGAGSKEALIGLTKGALNAAVLVLADAKGRPIQMFLLARGDLPLVFHPARTGARWSFTPVGAG